MSVYIYIVQYESVIVMAIVIVMVVVMIMVCIGNIFNCVYGYDYSYSFGNYIFVRILSLYIVFYSLKTLITCFYFTFYLDTFLITYSVMQF